jgi:hypothetical protein
MSDDGLIDEITICQAFHRCGHGSGCHAQRFGQIPRVSLGVVLRVAIDRFQRFAF